MIKLSKCCREKIILQWRLGRDFRWRLYEVCSMCDKKIKAKGVILDIEKGKVETEDNVPGPRNMPVSRMQRQKQS